MRQKFVEATFRVRVKLDSPINLSQKNIKKIERAIKEEVSTIILDIPSGDLCTVGVKETSSCMEYHD